MPFTPSHVGYIKMGNLSTRPTGPHMENNGFWGVTADSSASGGPSALGHDLKDFGPCAAAVIEYDSQESQE